jgi:hypothetical protein
MPHREAELLFFFVKNDVQVLQMHFFLKKVGTQAKDPTRSNKVVLSN